MSSTFAQRRPERKPRRHTQLSTIHSDDMDALNEGRSVNPGDTLGRHDVREEVQIRSTKAGA